jgi:type I restriction enzyme M protein
VILPDGVLFGSSKAPKELRRTLVEEHFLEGVVSPPSGVFRPVAGVSTAILLFSNTGRGGTELLWFYDRAADGWSLDDKRNPLLPPEKLGPTPKEALGENEHGKNNLPDCLSRWKLRKDSERERERTARPWKFWLAELRAIEQEILQGIEELEGMVR